MKKTKIANINVNEKDWLAFKEKYYLGMSKRLRELIRLDLENKLDTSQSPSPLNDRHSKEIKTD